MFSKTVKNFETFPDKTYKKNPKMSFCMRLKVLLWKNWMLRKRNKWRSITEILWPLIMILLVVLLHRIGEKQSFPNCHFKSKAMPSAGGLLFMQTFLCALNNTCDTERNATNPCFNGSLISETADAVQEAFNLKSLYSFNFKESRKDYLNFKQWAKDLLIVESIIEALKVQEMGSQELYLNQLFKNTTTYMCRSLEDLEFEKFTENADKSARDLLILSRAKREIYESGFLHLLYQQMKNNSSEDTKEMFMLNGLKIIDNLLCGPNVPGLMSQVNSLIQSGRKKTRKSEETMDLAGSQYIVEPHEWENDTTAFCNNLIQNLESTYPTRVVFRLFKPLIRGKLVYTPNAPVINKIMFRINETLSQIQNIIDLLKKESSKNTTAMELDNIIYKIEQDDLLLRKIANSEIGKTIVNNFSNDSSDDKDASDGVTRVHKLKKYLKSTRSSLKRFYKNFPRKNNFSKLIPYLECIDTNRIIPMEKESTAVNEALYWLNKERLWGLIVFQNVSSDSETLPSSLTYKIRTGIERTPNTNRLQDRVYVPKVRRNIIYDLREITGGFAYLQNMIESELIKEYTGRKYVPGIYLKQTPYPCHIYDSFRNVITRTFPMFMVISWIFIFCMVSKRIVAEKETLLKGTLRIFGVTNSQHWIAWFIDAFVPMIFVTTLISVLLVKGGLIPNSSILVIWMFLTAFVLPTITLAFLVSTFFFKSSIAMAVSGMVYFLLYLPYPPIQNFGELFNPHFKILTCLISNVAFGLGCTWIANMEEIGAGATLDKINFSPVPGNPITMSLVIEMFLIDSVIYLLLAIYFENVFDGSDHVKLPWYYCLTPSYWKKNLEKNEKNSSSHDQQYKNPRYFEAEPQDLRPGIEVVNVSRAFGRGAKKKTVVKNITINFYEDQITSFLGHNGAGKTTTVSMMIGLLPTTEGSIYISGVDIKEHSRSNVQDIGICWQENVLLDDLTVVEHFKLFAKLKNRSALEIETDIKELIGDLKLGHRAQQPVKILSGGMKRKVCVAMAFIGGSRTVFLDEPTAGIDPHARRSIWELLTKYKKGRTIILTTHFLDEADILGDRIAIIAAGELQCCGSSMFLKNNFGEGYSLTIESNLRPMKMNETYNGLKENLLSAQIKELSAVIKGIISSAEFLEQVGSEIVFKMPPEVSADYYSTLFTKLNENKVELNIASFGVNDTSLEEVFIKILLEAEKKFSDRNQDKITTSGNQGAIALREVQSKEKKYINSMTRNESLNEKKKSKLRLIKKQIIALWIKRYCHHKRNYKILLIEVFLPALFMAIALALSRTLPKVSVMPPLVMDMSAYASSSIFYTNEFPQNQNISAYENVLLSPYGLGTKCVLYPETCSLNSIRKGSLLKNNEYQYEDSNNCSCSKGFLQCFNKKELSEPPSNKTSEGFKLYNLTGLNLKNWLLTTELKYSPFRFGGISFGYYSTWTGISIQEFLNLFMYQKFVHILSNFTISPNILIDPKELTRLLMSTSCNKSFGLELFKDRDLTDNIVIWFNNRGWISSLAMMNGVTNLILRASLPNGSDPSKYSIRLINHPLPITKRQLEDQIELQTNVALICALSVIWALSFIPATYAVYLVEENTSGLKNLQIVSGLNRVIYWVTNLIWDLMSYSVSVFSIVLLYFLFGMTAFVGKESIATFIVLFYAYGFVNIAFVYMISFKFSISSSAFIFVACWNILSGVGTLLSTFTLSLISSKENPYYLNDIFIIFPQFCFGKSLVNMALEGVRKSSLENFGVKAVSAGFDWNSTLKYIVVMLVIGIVFFVITLLIEYQFIQKFVIEAFSKRFSRRIKDNAGDHLWRTEDDDVRLERERVESGKAKDDSDVLIINNLTKFYSRREPPAVDHICVGVKHGECFGLLGLNGAGKTTVFKMLTGCVMPSEGDATIGGFSIKDDPLKAEFLMGYCPQMNALDPYLTVEEHLSLFCRIRGVSSYRRKREVAINLQRFGLTDQKNQIVKKLSGGNKRKVNTAIALVCDPELVLLDEPTSGMDVLSKRLLWQCLQDVMSEGRCVVLTSHSMEECQALCTHLSIMVHGKFACFGSCQHLKNKFNEGYCVLIRLLNNENSQNVTEYVEKNLPDSTLIHIHNKLLKYKMSPNIFIGTIFNVLNKAKKDNLIQDYSITQTTLENIFLKLADSAEDAKIPESKFKYFKRICCNKF